MRVSKQFVGLLLIALELTASVTAVFNQIDSRTGGTAKHLSLRDSFESANVKGLVAADDNIENRLKKEVTSKVNDAVHDNAKPTKTKRKVEKRSIDDLLNMDHPDFTGDDWMETFRNHVKEIHKRGHRLQLRQEMIDPEAMEALMDSGTILNVDSEATRLSETPDATNVTYTQVPIDPKEIFYGVATGIGGVFVPGLRDANNGTEAMATFQQCFDPRKLHETFAIKGLFKTQNEMPTLSEKDIEEFQKSTEGDGGKISEFLGRLKNLSGSARRMWNYLGAIMKQMAPYLLTILKHSYRCGVIDILLGVALGFILPFFPALLIMIVAVGAVAFELFTQVKAMIDNWYKDWFKFGKGLGAVIGFLTIMIVAYKMSRSKEVTCKGKGQGCSYDMPENEIGNWKPPKSKKHCNGDLCNPVYRKDDLIDPYLIDSMGRTNVQRMKAGRAAIGPDGKPINLHHLHQEPDGIIVELTDTFHSTKHGELHTFLKPGEPSKIDRAAFDLWRNSYWRSRGKEMEAALAAGTHAWTSGGGARNIVPTAVVAVTKSWDSVQDGVPKVGDWIGKIIDDMSDGDDDSQVTSVKKSLGFQDLVRLILRAIRGKIVDEANELDNEMKKRSTGVSQAHEACSLSASCTAAIPLEADRLDRADGLVEKEVSKTYETHFAPDTGYALLLSTKVSEGSVQTHVVRAADDAAPLAASAARGVKRTLVTAPSEKELPQSEQRVTLQHCDGHGPYRVLVTGTREAARPEDYASEDPKWQEFWAKNGAPPDATQSIFNIGAQYVPYPTLPAGAYAEASGDVAVVPAAKGAVRYHLHVAAADAPALNTPCDVMRVAPRVATAPHSAASDGSVNIALPDDVDGGRGYVLAESDGGAFALYGNNAEGDEAGQGIDLSKGLGGGAIFGIFLLCLCYVACIVVGILFYLKKSGKISTRLPQVRNGKLTLA